MFMLTYLFLTSLISLRLVFSQKVVIVNDDGWAVAQIRAEYEELTKAGYDVILSAPALNWSGSGSLSVPALPLVGPCQYNSCPAFSPAYGRNKSDARLNYINAAPSDSAHYGIKTLAPAVWGTPPDLVVSGPNIGNNLELAVFTSGTIGAASRSALDGVPAIAFSGADSSIAREAWMELTSSPTSSTVLAARTYASLTTTFLDALFLQAPKDLALLPAGIILNVNFPAVSLNCPATPGSIKWVFTRALPSVLGTKDDAQTCDNGGRLPTESSVMNVSGGCYATVSVLDAQTKLDANSGLQADVLTRLKGLGFSCVSTATWQSSEYPLVVSKYTLVNQFDKI